MAFAHQEKIQRARLGEEIPAAPLVEWMKAELDRLRADDTLRGDEHIEVPADQALAFKLGVSERTAFRYKHSQDAEGQPTTTFRRNSVEDMLEHAGVDFADLYPEIVAAEDRPLEPDAFCSSCRDVVTPIDGRCPWCDRLTVAEVPRRMYCPREDAVRFPANDGNCWRCGGVLRQHIPRTRCACGCGELIPRFNPRTGLPCTHKLGHGRGGFGAKGELPLGPFADWLEDQLRDLDPIQALARRVGMPREVVLAVLGRRLQTVPTERVVRALWKAGLEGQGAGVGMRPGSVKINELYPDRGGVLRCPECGGRKVAKAALCRSCRLEAGWASSQPNRPTSMTPEVLAEARRLREAGWMWKQISVHLLPRTRCSGEASVRSALIAQFRKRGWPTERGAQERAAA